MKGQKCDFMTNDGIFFKSCSYQRVASCNPFFDFGQWSYFWLRVEREWAENEKQREYYDPYTCAYMGEPGCTFPDCDSCECCFGDEEDEDW